MHATIMMDLRVCCVCTTSCITGRSEEEKDAMRKLNREKFKEASRMLILNCAYLSLDNFPKQICDQNLRELILDNNVLEVNILRVRKRV
jgi:hypothetical protein